MFAKTLQKCQNIVGIDSHFNNIIIQRRMGILNGKKLNIKPIGFGDGNYLRKFSVATSLHGVIYLGEPKRPCLERIFWICVMSLVFLMCGYQTYQLYNNWMKSHIITILEENKKQLTAMDYVPFPGITICSDLQLQNLESKIYNNQTFYKEYEDSINLLCRLNKPNLVVSQDFINKNTWDLLINNHGIPCEQRVISLSWIRENIKIPCQYFQPIYTNYGICYSLNMVPFHQLLNTGYNQMLMNFNHQTVEIITKANGTIWNPEIGFSKNVKQFNIPWKVIGDSVEDSVRITFSLKKDNSGKHCPELDSGLALFLHSPIDVPASMQPAAYIAVNNIAYITTTYTLRETSSSLASWAPKVRHCYYQHERTLKFFKIYSTTNCDVECRANNTLKMCGCVAYYHPRDINTPICGTKKFRCMRQYSNNGYSIFNKYSISRNVTNDCNCLDLCNEIRYQHDVVYTHRNLSKSIKNEGNKNNTDLSIVVMYYKRNIWNTKRTALIPVNELLGNIGGLLGLFLGASIVSVFEIIYFSVIRLYVDRWNQKKVKQNITI